MSQLYRKRGERLSSTVNTAKTAGDLQPRSRTRASADGKSLSGDIQNRGFLLNWLPVLAKNRKGQNVIRGGDGELG